MLGLGYFVLESKVLKNDRSIFKGYRSQFEGIFVDLVWDDMSIKLNNNFNVL